MRRKDLEITDYEVILDIMKKCDVCDVAFFDEEFPYIVPLNFGVVRNQDTFSLYFHGAGAGKKIDVLAKNNHVGFSMNCGHNLILDEKACECTMEYESVCGNGIIESLNETDKMEAMIMIMKQYQDKDEYVFNEASMKHMAILKLTVHEITGKKLVHKVVVKRP